MKSFSCFACALLLSTMIVQSATASAEPMVWFSPGDDLEVNGKIAHSDFSKLFNDPLSWAVGLSHINVFQFRAPYITRKPAEAFQYYSFLKAHGIGFAATMTVLPSDTCGEGVEGITTFKGMDFYPRAIRAAGIELDFVAMDEPLFFGHDFSGTNACRLPVAEVAKRVAQSVEVIRSYHPRAKFILSEPEQSLIGGAPELAEFLDDFREVAHEYPASVRLDVQWRRDWRTELRPFLEMLSARHIRYGVIYNAPGGIRDDHTWIMKAKENVRQFSQAINLAPDHVMLQTWDPSPIAIVPEDNLETMTGYLKWFVTGGSKQPPNRTQ